MDFFDQHLKGNCLIGLVTPSRPDPHPEYSKSKVSLGGGQRGRIKLVGFSNDS